MIRLSLLALVNTMSSNSALGSGTGSGSGSGQLLRLCSVPGFEQHRVNDVLLLTPTGTEAARRRNAHVVFFPGDIQNFEQEMSQHPDLVPWQRWSLERVALVLGSRFPGRYVWLVRASRVYLHKFSCYNNFVQSNAFGAPQHSPSYGALRHLRALLGHASQRAGLPGPLPPLGGGGAPSSPTPPPPRGFSLTLVGFSKGCVVLNQVVYELGGARTDPQLRPFLDTLTDVYWLDGGHPGGGDTWVTDREALGELAEMGVAVHAHVTPYEVRDPARAWVGREHARFVRTLQELGAHVTNKMHFEDEPASIENHFRVIEEF